MTTVDQRRAAQYAHERYRRILRNYRRRIRRPVLVITLPSVTLATAIAIWLDRGFWWWMAGLWTGAMLAVAMWAFDDPPEHVAKWGRGAEGERLTAKELRVLEREGWRIEHDHQKEHYNVDHIAIGPFRWFMIETKTSTGSVSIEDGLYTVRWPDDPEATWTHKNLGRTMRQRAAELWNSAANDPDRKFVHAVVAIWAPFPEGLVHHDRVTYVHGSRLLAFLRDPDSILQSGEL